MADGENVNMQEIVGGGQEGNQDIFNLDIPNLQDVGDLIPGEELQEEEKKPVEEVKPTVDENGEVITEESQSEEKKEDTPSSQDIKDSSPLTPYAKFVVEEGVLSNFDIEKWDGSAEGLVQAMKDEVQLGVNTYKETLDPRVKWLADNVDDGVPLQNLLQLDEQRVTLDNINVESLESDETLQKGIATQYYKETTKFSDTEIEKAVERIEATGELKEAAVEYFDKLKQINTQKEQEMRQQAIAQKEAAKKQEQEVLNNFKSTLDGTAEVIPGIKLNTAVRDQVFKTLTTPVDVNPQTGMPMTAIDKAAMEDPVNFQIAFGTLWHYTKGFKDWSAIIGAGKKDAIKNFEDTVKNMDFNRTTEQKIQKPTGNQDLVDQMAAFSNYGNN